MAQYKGAASEAGRAMHLMKKREKQREQMEQMKQRIAEVRAGSLGACALPRSPGCLAPRSGPGSPGAMASERGRRAGAGPWLADFQQSTEASRRVSSVKWALSRAFSEAEATNW